MKILFVTRPDAQQVVGGDTVQLLKTQQGLQKLGVEVQLGVPDAENLAWADIVHVFNAQTPETSLPALQNARQAGKKTVLSTIWWDLSHARLAERVGRLGLPVSPLTRLLLPASKAVFNVLKAGWRQDVRATLQSADLLLPNSEEEMQVLRREFGSALPPHHVVLNAVDREIFTWAETGGQGVVCFARLQPAKNQLNLIRAMPPNVPLTLVGRGDPTSRFVQAVEQEAEERGFVVLNQHVSQAQVANLMRLHAVHALPSLRESPGLSSLESLASGLNVVVSRSEYCPTHTYFKELLGRHVFDCDPYRLGSLHEAITSALQWPQPASPPLDARFDWNSVAAETLFAYRKLLGYGY